MGDKRTKQRITSKIDELPEDLRMKVDVMLADTSNTYEYISQFLKGEGYDISKSSVGRYATRTNNAMQRLLEAQAQTDRLIQVVKENPEADYTEAAILLTMNGLLNKVATAEEEFNEMPLDKAGMDGRVQDINNAGIVTGLYGRAKESQSIGEVKSFPISEAKLLKLLPEGIEDYIETLDKAKYVTIRQYIGKEDYYVTSANMMSPEGSDYSYAEDVRVSNRLVKAVRAKALDELQVEVDPGDIETSITNIQEQLNTPVEDAVRDKVISSGSVTIDTENLNILVDEKLDINITYVPMGHVREMGQRRRHHHPSD